MSIATTTKRTVMNQLNELSPREWIAETVSVFVQKGLGANHQEAQIEREHPAPFSYQDVQRLINFFTKPGDKVLDPFSGVGSTLKACALSNRDGYGIELVGKFHSLARKRLATEIDKNLLPLSKQTLIQGDAREEIRKFKTDFFDFIVTSPPYWNILKNVDHKATQRLNNGLATKYSDSPKDLGNIQSYEDFLDTLVDFFEKCSRILKPKKYLCIIVSDFRHKDRLYMFHADLASRLSTRYYKLKGITILYQKHKKVYPYGYPYAYVPNIHHQYVLILRNDGKE